MRIIVRRAREMAQQSEVSAVLAGDLRSIPNTQARLLTLPVISAPGEPTFSCDLRGQHSHTHSTLRHALIDIAKNKI